MNTLFPNLPFVEVQQPAGEAWPGSPAGISFSEYRNRLIWGPPDAQGKRDCIDRKLLREPFPYTIREKDNEYRGGEDPEYGRWAQALESGRSYLVGDDVPMSEFLRRHTSALTTWQRQAYLWCLANPLRCLVLRSTAPRREYEVRKRGDYVEIGLPHQDWGGERHWITRDGKRKVLVNVD